MADKDVGTTAVGAGAPAEESSFEPHVVAFTCKWCTYAAADMAGTQRLTYPSNVRIVRLPCTGNASALYLLKAFQQGADGVIVSGCHPGDCNYVEGNLLARRRFAIIRYLLRFIGLDERRIHFAWISASEGAKWADFAEEAIEEVRAAGPLYWAEHAESVDPEEIADELPEPDPPDRDPPSQETAEAVTAHLQDLARELLASGEVDRVIGYPAAAVGGQMGEEEVTDPEDADELGWGESCVKNLANNLPDRETDATTALVVKPCDARTAVGLLQESQVGQHEIVQIGVPCVGVWDDGELAEKCWACPGGFAQTVDWSVTADGVEDGVEEFESVATAPDPRGERVDALWELPAEHRWAFWKDQFEACIRCDLCRNICPMCYCETCISEKTDPQWIPEESDLEGNIAWNLIRAIHLAGRCGSCDECFRVCPTDVHIDFLNYALTREIEDRFGYRTGEDPDAEPPLTTFREDDQEEFIA